MNLRFGPMRGAGLATLAASFVPATLMAALEELEEAYGAAKVDDEFQQNLSSLLHHYAGRPTSLYFAENLTRHCGGARIYLKREDLAHTGAHKINNALGQALLARHMGKERIIAETGAGQHGVATATVCAMLGLQCVVYMGEEDIRRQALNVFRMRLLEAEVITVESGTRTLKDAINEAIRDWVTNVESTHYLIGSAVGPHPLPHAGAGLPVCHKQGGPGPDYRCRGPLARLRGGLRGRRQQRHRYLLRVHRGRGSLPGGRGSRGRGSRIRPPFGHPERRAARGAARLNVLPAPGTGMGRCTKPTAFPRGWTTRAWDRSTVT